MTDADFLTAILADPADDTPRLVFADWLEEHGQPERAQFIRLQCSKKELATIEDRANRLRMREIELLPLQPYPFRYLQFLDYSGTRMRCSPSHNMHPAFVVQFLRGFIHSVECTWAAWREHGTTIIEACPDLRDVRIADRENLPGANRHNLSEREISELCLDYAAIDMASKQGPQLGPISTISP